MIKWGWFCSLLLVVGAAACSSDGAKTVSGAGRSEAVTVSADEGGTVDVGDAALKIPGGSLTQDIDVTVETATPASGTPEKDTVIGLVYDFGPDGTTFDPPATLELPLDRTPGPDQVAVLSWLDEEANTWVDLETSVSGETVSAPIAHFTKFVVRLKGAGSGPVDCSFSACGGDLEGTWTITTACIESDDDDDNPFGEICASAVYDVSLDASGTVVFGADDSFEFTLTGEPNISIMLPAECLASPMFPFPDCATLGAELAGDDGDVSCAGNDSTGCKCTGSGGEPVEQHKVGTYTVSGNTFTASEAGSTDDEPTEYCVKGSTLKVKTKDGSIIQAERKK